LPTYNSFEDLPVWKEAKELAVLIYKPKLLNFLGNKSRGNYNIS